MRRALAAAVAVPLLLLAACGSEEGPEVSEPQAPAEQTTDEAPPEEPTEEEPTADEVTTPEPTEEVTDDLGTDDPTEEITSEEPTEEVTEEPTDDATDEGTDEEPAGDTADGEAASARVKEMFTVMFSDSPGDLCGLLVDFTGSGPLSENPTSLQMCEETLAPEIEKALTDIPGDPGQIAGVLDVLEIAPARVDGDTALVGAEEFGELFGAGFGDGDIQLQKFDGEWYIDILNSDAFS